MAVTTLARYETQDGIELVINQQTGESFATISGYARMAELTRDAIYKRLSRGTRGVDKKYLKNSEILTPKGIQAVDIIPADIVFKWLIVDNPKLAFAMGKAGATLYMHQIAGFKLPSAEKATPTVESSLTDKELLKTFTDLYARATRTGNKRLLLIAENNIADIAEKINPGSDSYDDTQPDYSKLNPVERFIASKVQVTNHWADKVLSSELYDAFVRWNGSASISRSKFTRTVVSLKIGEFQEKMSKDKKRTSGFFGIRIIND